MNVKEVHFSLEILVGRTCKEIKATVKAEDSVCLLNNGANGGKADYVIIACAAGNVAKRLYRVGSLCGVYVVKLDSKLLRVLYGIDALSAGQTGIVNIGNNEQRGSSVTVEGIVDSAKSHRTYRGEKSHFTALADTHIVNVATCLGVVHSLKGADNTAHRLGKRAVEINV